MPSFSTLKMVIMSDTHGYHRNLKPLAGDVLIHSGDFVEAFGGDFSGLQDIDEWFSTLDFESILCTGGNHDFSIEQRLKRGKVPLKNAVFLQDTLLELSGYRFYGAPWVPDLSGWAFYQDSRGLKQKWLQIPDEVDVLITHTPPQKILDLPTHSRRHLGCQYLSKRVEEIQPTIHCFGHVHASYGQTKQNGTHFINASIYSRGGLNEPVIFYL